MTDMLVNVHIAHYAEYQTWEPMVPSSCIRNIGARTHEAAVTCAPSLAFSYRLFDQAEAEGGPGIGTLRSDPLDPGHRCYLDATVWDSAAVEASGIEFSTRLLARIRANGGRPLARFPNGRWVEMGTGDTVVPGRLARQE